MPWEDANTGGGDTFTSDQIVNASDVEGTNVSEALNNTGERFEAMREPAGFPIISGGEIDRTSSVLSWNNISRTLAISPSNVSFDYYVNGVKLTSTGASKQINDIEGLWFFWFDSSGVLQTSQVFDLEYIYGEAFVAFVYWDASNKTIIGELFDERHGTKMDGHTHGWLHTRFGTAHESGGALNNVIDNGNGDLDSHAQFGIDASVIHDEDLHFELSAILSTTGLPILHLEGAENTPKLRLITNAGFSMVTTGTGRLAYNQLTGGVWQLTELTNRDYVLCHVFATSGSDINGKYFAVIGQNDYLTGGQAKSGASTEIKTLLNILPVQEKDWIATVIFQTSDVYVNSIKARVQPDDNGNSWTDWRWWDYKDFLKDTSI